MALSGFTRGSEDTTAARRATQSGDRSGLFGQ
jgi:hypothetical protein